MFDLVHSIEKSAGMFALPNSIFTGKDSQPLQYPLQCILEGMRERAK